MSLKRLASLGGSEAPIVAEKARGTNKGKVGELRAYWVCVCVWRKECDVRES